MNSPKISVIIPVYNAEKYLRQCLDSIINQTLQDIEIICVDDGSTDSSNSILIEYQRQDIRVRVIRQENAGAGQARNQGIKLAKGKYLLFLDSDDFFEQNLCESLYRRAEETSAQIVFYDGNVYDQANNQFINVNWLLNREYLPSTKVFNRHDVSDYLFLIVSGGPWNKLWARHFILDNHLHFPNMRSLEDVPFVYTAIALADRISVVPEILAHYRRFAPKQGLVSKIEQFPKRIFESYDLLKTWLNDYGVFNDVQQSFINRAINDFVDQYLYIIKDVDVAEYYKLYLIRVASYHFNLRNISRKNSLNKFIASEFNKLLKSDERYEQLTITPKISIVVPVYNSEPFLYKCINSILKQTFSDFEIIFVDDGSTDNSVKILQQYQEIDKRICILTQNHQFAGAARNKGIEVARGEYLLFLDSDDFFEKDFLQELFNSANQFDSDVVICDGNYFDNNTKTFKQAQYFLQTYNIPAQMPFSYRDIPNKILHISIDCPWNKLFRADFIQKHNLRFQNLRSANDMFFVDCALLLAEKISVVNKRLVNYRINVKSSLQANRSKEPLNFYEALCAIKKRMSVEKQYVLIEKCLYSLFITACKFHLNNAKNEEEFVYLYSFYQRNAFPEWGLTTENDIYIYSDDKVWVQNVLCNTHQEYFSIYRDKIVHIPQLKENLPNIIVSLTSYPKRIATVHRVIQNILDQTFQPTSIVLWLAEDQFPGKFNDLPKELNDLLSSKFQILWTEDIKSYKKLIPALEAFPEDIIITVDDDLLFDSRLIEKLVAGYQENPHYIHCHRITSIRYYGLDKIETIPDAKHIYPRPTYLHKLSGGAGCLYPPHSLHPDVKRKELFLKLAPSSDDIWFWLMGALNGYKVNVVKDNMPELHYIEGTQEEALWKINDCGEKLFFKHLRNILQYYPVLQEVLRYEQYFFDNNFVDLSKGISVQSGFESSQLVQKVKMLTTEIDNIHASATYKIGRAITWFPRKLRGLIMCLQEHGWTYTGYRILVHLHLKRDDYSSLAETSTASHFIPPDANDSNAPAKQTNVIRNYEYYSHLAPSQYAEELKIWYKRITKEELNLENPQTFNEKIQWLKLYDSTPIKTKLADKYLVRNWIKEQIGEEYLVPLLGVWNDFDEIDFDKLPNQFVLKANHGSGWNIIVKDKSQFNFSEAKSKFDSWMHMNFAFTWGFELHYLNIKPKIIAEQYIEEMNQVYDYKFLCFDGVLKLIWVDTDRFTSHKRTLFTPNWEKRSERLVWPSADYNIPKPHNFDKMVAFSQQLSKGFAHARVDFYEVNGKLYFGEITFTSSSGTEHAIPREFEYEMGSWLKLPPKSPIPERKVW